ncbi:hypothetical protein A3C57_02245 [Candidatus Nomurabacteria bacterium RIFCSPHIGHO2_02_FULL_33_12]|uniref:Uncharacterized protein n=1 Tax=Candidatus Nomurabacteria bacterium RIFCSPLOWO2_01_FULL_33_17 TaxID=1801764 RepID=A0A1F6WMP6_9BACT|nr:MAG: hypothetical protein A3C57_02245 [Candidatus Nomurabacteria bacterium RIFCSPHIGHO2_02_FULL_33_12]OGI83148.1 MAG: hypothetical protein A2903_02020 [Candidatus Nomurabacteria bacterium RIFCSPLOWO2_01_FULL_33_17]
MAKLYTVEPNFTYTGISVRMINFINFVLLNKSIKFIGLIDPEIIFLDITNMPKTSIRRIGMVQHLMMYEASFYKINKQEYFLWKKGERKEPFKIILSSFKNFKVLKGSAYKLIKPKESSDYVLIKLSKGTILELYNGDAKKVLKYNDLR